MKLHNLFTASLLAAALVAPLANAQTSEPATDKTWWKHAVIYEIYPRSFQDTNGDGMGDLNGITQRLDYLKELGVDAIWISPMFPSPQVDFGYDISDYRGVDRQYGTMKDMDRLLAEAKKRNIKILLDFVLNHTSDKHPWFIESASSKNNPKRDWYIWRDGKNTGTVPCNPAHQNAAPYTPPGCIQPPTNWVSIFGGSAWEFNDKTKQFYYHAFYTQQPDLNWRNPQVEKAMFDVLRFWMDKGVYGFRLDAVPELFETVALKDEALTNKKNKYGDILTTRTNSHDLPEVHDTMRRMRGVVDSYHDGRVLIGETYLPNVEDLDKWYGGAKKDELQLPMDMQVGFTNKLDATRFRKLIGEAETEIHGSQPLFVFDNHDRDRSWDRYGKFGKTPEQKLAIAKLLATMLLTSRSTALMYYGQEIGMTTDKPARKEDVRDPNGIHGWPKEKGRDGERRPMQWDSSAQAGFSTNATTWLGVTPNYTTINVAAEKANPNSLLNWYKQLTALRRNNAALHEGSMTMINTSDANVLSWVRSTADGKMVVVSMNMSAEPQKIALALPSGKAAQSVHTLVTSDDALKNASTLDVTLAPYASWVAEVK
ncbi:MAG: alpha-glucosidase [Acidobacteria bacterium]|nr:alpha-glucosidase [Acidobacteriota bacterium]